MKKDPTAERKKPTKRSSATAEDYLYTVDWSEDDAAYIARVAEFQSLAAHGDSQEAALHSLRRVVKVMVKDLDKSNEPVPQPLS